jgi:uncharacterized membrane protein
MRVSPIVLTVGRRWEEKLKMKLKKDEKPSVNPLKSYKTLYFLIFLIIAGCASRFFWLGRESLWLDEAVSLNIANKIRFLHFNGLFFSKWEDPHPFFYYFLLYLWTKLFGISEVALRSMSAVLGVLLITSIYYVGSRAISKKVGAIASVLLLVNPVALYYSQEARMYTLVPLLILFSTFYFYRLLTKPDKKNITLYIMISSTLMYTDYLGALLLLMHVSFSLWKFFQTREKRIFRILIFAYIAIFFLYIPWLPNVLQNLNWGMIAWMNSPSALEGVTVTLKLMGVQFMHVENIKESINFLDVKVFTKMMLILSYISLYVWAILVLIVGLIISLKEKTSFKTLVAMLCFVPLVKFLISISIIPIFNLRQASVYFPEMGLTMASGLIAMASFIQRRFKAFTTRPVWIWLLYPLLIINLVCTSAVYTVDTKENWRQIAMDMETISGNKPIGIYKEYMAEPFLYYYHGSARVIRIRDKDLSKLGLSVDSDEFILILSHVNPTYVLPTIQRNFLIRKVHQYLGAEVYFLKKNGRL